MQRLNDACEPSGKRESNIDFSIYGTRLSLPPISLLSAYRSAGIIKGVTDKNYITNSYHVHVTEQINAFDKLKFESQFQKLSPGGAISYVEVPNMQDNIPCSAFSNAVHLRQYHVRRAEYKERLLPGMRLRRRNQKS